MFIRTAEQKSYSECFLLFRRNWLIYSGITWRSVYDSSALMQSTEKQQTQLSWFIHPFPWSSVNASFYLPAVSLLSPSWPLPPLTSFLHFPSCPSALSVPWPLLYNPSNHLSFPFTTQTKTKGITVASHMRSSQLVALLQLVVVFRLYHCLCNTSFSVFAERRTIYGLF